MSAAVLTRRAVGYLFHPRHATGQREFLVTVRDDGANRDIELTVWATSSIDAILKVQDQRGHLGRITAEAI